MPMLGYTVETTTCWLGYCDRIYYIKLNKFCWQFIIPWVKRNDDPSDQFRLSLTNSAKIPLPLLCSSSKCPAGGYSLSLAYQKQHCSFMFTVNHATMWKTDFTDPQDLFPPTPTRTERNKKEKHKRRPGAMPQTLSWHPGIATCTE